MIRVETIRDLKKIPISNEPVFVRSVDKIFVNYDGEWIERAYYTTRDISLIINTSERQVRNLIRKLNLRPKVMSGNNLSFDVLDKIIKAVKIKRSDARITYSKIREELNI